MVPSSLKAPAESPVAPLDLKTKLAYGTGEVGKEIVGSILVFFVLFFLTNVAGLSPSLAGAVLMLGRVWDAINDPLVGWLSDRTRSRWGRRFPWMMTGAVPLGVCFCLQWWVPPTSQTWTLFAYYSVVVFFLYASLTAVSIPHSTLAAELTQGYDERTTLASFKASFSIGSSILGLVLAQFIFAAIADTRQQYLALGAVGGAIAILTTFLCVWGTYKRYWDMQAVRPQLELVTPIPMWQQVRIAFSNRPFLYVMGVYLCSWMGLQITAAILPYFVVDWMGLSDDAFTQTAIAVQGSALIAMFFWNALGQRVGKRAIYCMGIPLTLVSILGLFLLQPGQVGLMYGLAIATGIGLATAYLVPWSMLPDAIDLDELNTGQRREGIFCGFLIQLQKFGTAIAIFLVGNALEWAGLVTGLEGQSRTVQPELALQTIRWLIGPLPAFLLAIGIVLAALYPISRSFHEEIVLKLKERSGK
ncbi:MAG: MFS transporter [Coleofasciculaceae cyanobacterium SM2_3_26]|nr:MFS transporter [Coleofasciculaceae cyanobacterium SM2_3_26]